MLRVQAQDCRPTTKGCDSGMGFSELVLQLVLYGKVVVFWPILTECCQLISSPLATRPTNKQKVYHFTVAFDLCICKRKTTKKCKRKKVALLPIHHFTPCDRVFLWFFFGGGYTGITMYSCQCVWACPEDLF